MSSTPFTSPLMMLFASLGFSKYGRFCHNLRDEISMFFHLLTLLTIFPSYLADQKYCMLKDLGEHYPCAKSDEPTLINYEMAK